jgi:hypothetical protein
MHQLSPAGEQQKSAISLFSSFHIRGGEKRRLAPNGCALLFCVLVGSKCYRSE